MKVGQTVYLRPHKFANARTKKQGIKEATVKKVGRKYAHLDSGAKYDMSTGLDADNYNSIYVMYPNKEALDVQFEHEELERKVRQAIPTNGEWEIDIEKLRQIVQIIESCSETN